MREPGTEGKLDELMKLTKKNNQMLRAMRRDAWIGLIFKILLWAIILGAPVFFYFYFFEPYLNHVIELTEGVQQGVQTIEEAGNSLPKLPDFGGLFDFLRPNQ